METVYIKCSRN